ncbi:undecaprenyl-diphosphate phosphatase [Halobaculum sp. MBLA0147]|uniref:undecaprenyl-diphosphate phosphatase n=1 Tax=Halobaculum sp. MBLA0147 TaxID=3079934 RepID=UPI0035231AF9
MDRALLVAVVVGVVQGIFEWLPISSEGNVALALSLLGRSPEEAVAFALFLHVGTAGSAAVYYRTRLGELLRALPRWRPWRDGHRVGSSNSGGAQASLNGAGTGVAGEGASTSAGAEGTPGTSAADEEIHRTLTFFAVATLASGIVGITAYETLVGFVSETGGGVFVVVVGVLLVATGAFQRLSDERATETKTTPTLVDAVVVGAGQGLAILPGVSRSGTTTGLLLLRGYEESRSFELSFVLSIPAALGAGVLAFLDTGLAVTVGPAVAALVVAGLVGYLTIDALLRIVERVAFWAVCVGLGGLAVVGGTVLVV